MIDDPSLLKRLFHPRRDRPGSERPEIRDGLIPTTDQDHLGYRLHIALKNAPLIVFFHGNGEIASDYDEIAERFLQHGISLLIADYRGYGWSSGSPRLSTFLSDAEVVARVLPDLVKREAVAPDSYWVMGRSLGSATATHLAVTFPDRFSGLIVESGFSQKPSIFHSGAVPAALEEKILHYFDNSARLAKIAIPTLIIHGEDDSLLPPQNAHEMYHSARTVHKELLMIPEAEHNTIHRVGSDIYYRTIARFLQENGRSSVD